MWEEIKGIAGALADKARMPADELIDFMLGMGWWGIIPLFFVVICLFLAAVVGLLGGPVVTIISAIALVVSVVGHLAIEGVEFSLAKPLAGIGVGVSWTAIGLLVAKVFENWMEDWTFDTFIHIYGIFAFFWVITLVIGWLFLYKSIILAMIMGLFIVAPPFIAILYDKVLSYFKRH